MALQTSLPPAHLERYVRRQLEAHFPDDADHDYTGLIAGTLPRLEHCFAAINHRAYGTAQSPLFDHLHADQYTTFLYYA